MTTGEIMDYQDIPLYKHAEMWWSEQGKKVPSEDTEEYRKMYEKWVEFAYLEI